MSTISYPCVLFKTRKPFNDYSSDDMRYGDMNAAQLKALGFANISSRVDPYTLKKKINLPTYHSQSVRLEQTLNKRDGHSILSAKECADILFDEMRNDPMKVFTAYGPYAFLMDWMIDHMQSNSGAPFHSTALDRALKERILGDKSDAGPMQVIREALGEYIDWEQKVLTKEGVKDVHEEISTRTHLPKFNKIHHKFNGTTITVHDIHAMQITLESLKITGNRFIARVNFKGQDHFGLDIKDVSYFLRREAPLFQKWFVLQRYERFAYKPFFTHMQVTVEIEGMQ